MIFKAARGHTKTEGVKQRCLILTKKPHPAWHKIGSDGLFVAVCDGSLMVDGIAVTCWVVDYE
jgi:hypothetical protein